MVFEPREIVIPPVVMVYVCEDATCVENGVQKKSAVVYTEMRCGTCGNITPQRPDLVPPA